MRLRTKRLVVLWVVVAIISILLGLRYNKTENENNDPPSYSLREISYLYGQPIAFKSIYIAMGKTLIDESFNVHFLALPKYKYQLIVVTLLIGFALIMIFNTIAEDKSVMGASKTEGLPKRNKSLDDIRDAHLKNDIPFKKIGKTEAEINQERPGQIKKEGEIEKAKAEKRTYLCPKCGRDNIVKLEGFIPGMMPMITIRTFCEYCGEYLGGDPKRQLRIGVVEFPIGFISLIFAASNWHQHVMVFKEGRNSNILYGLIMIFFGFITIDSIRRLFGAIKALKMRNNKAK